ncbi:MAG: DnaA/Hda family protein [Candidatus Fermentibacteria bacterium]|nr:DnaA/Hda family protein [Candidatus Fermentibacteria bacterium]
MIDESTMDKADNRLHFVEFMQMCADSGYISEHTAREICLFAKYQGGVEAIPAFPGDNPDDNAHFTDLLAYALPGEHSFDNYVVTDENSYAVELARTVALIPRIWKSISPVLFHAGTGQGKTHLLSAITATSRQNTLFLNLNDLKMGYKYCVKTNKESQLLAWIVSHNFLLLDDLQFVQGDMEFQHFLCSVFNRMPQGKSAIVLCSNTEVENMQDFDSTFFSRISSGISIELKPIDAKGRIVVLEQMFRNTGFGPGVEIINYLATEITQNVRTLKAAGRAVLAHLLASPAKGDISIETVQNLLYSMNLRTISGNESVPSDSMQKARQKNDPLSPYIVVDIEDEVAGEDPDDELIFKKALEAEKATGKHKIQPSSETETAPDSATTPETTTAPEVAAVQTKVADPETVPEPVVEPVPEPVAEPTPEPVVEPVPEPVPEPVAEPTPEPVVKPVPEPVVEPVPEPVAEPTPEPVTEPVVASQATAETADSGKEKSIHMLESATTVNSQIDALKMAALRRIEQLEKKNPHSPEIAKLRFAIVFLNEGKIESAMLALK